MNEIVNKFLLVEDTFMSDMHLRQHGFTYSDCGPFTKNKKNELKKLEIQDIFIKTKWIKLVFIKIWIMEILKN